MISFYLAGFLGFLHSIYNTMVFSRKLIVIYLCATPTYHDLFGLVRICISFRSIVPVLNNTIFLEIVKVFVKRYINVNLKCCIWCIIFFAFRSYSNFVTVVIDQSECLM